MSAAGSGVELDLRAVVAQLTRMGAELHALDQLLQGDARELERFDRVAARWLQRCAGLADAAASAVDTLRSAILAEVTTGTTP